MVKEAGRRRQPAKRYDSQSSGMLGAAIFFGGIFLLICVLVLLVWQLGDDLFYASRPIVPANATPRASPSPAPTMAPTPTRPPAQQSVSTPQPVPASNKLPERVVLVKPGVPPDLYDRQKLVPTEPFVGLWRSTYYNQDPYDHYRLTIYNDGTYVIHDFINDTYITGKWTLRYAGNNFQEYRAFEGGKVGIVQITAHPDSLNFYYSSVEPQFSVQYRPTAISF